MRFEIELDDDRLPELQRAAADFARTDDGTGNGMPPVISGSCAAIWRQATFPITMPAELARWLADQPADWAELLGAVATLRREESAALAHLAAAARRHLPPKE